MPSLLEPCHRAKWALVEAVPEDYVRGVSTRITENLVRAVGIDGISKSQVSRLCQELGAEVERIRNRSLTGSYAYLWLDETYLKVRKAGACTMRSIECSPSA